MDRKIASDANVSTVAFSGDGALLRGLCQDGTLRSWDVGTGAIRQTITLNEGDTWDLVTGKVAKRLPAAGRDARRVSVSADGSVFYSSGRTEIKLHALDAAGKKRFEVPAGLGGIGAIAISPDGANIVAGSYDADVRAWNARNGELLRLIDELPVSMFDLKFSPDGKWLAAAGADRIVYIYDTGTWKISRRFTGQPEMISALAFSSGGSQLASGGFSELTQKRPVKVLIWDVKSGQKVRTFDASQRVSCIAFSPDDKLAAVSTGTKVIDLWQVAG